MYGARCETHYSVLCISETASQEEIKRSYHSALLLLHPDKLRFKAEEGDAEAEEREERLFRVQEAWAALRDASSRSEYDLSLTGGTFCPFGFESVFFFM